MPIKINGTTVINETLLADINLSNLSETGQNVIKSLISSEGGMKRPDYANGSMKNITVSGTCSNLGAISNVSYTSVTIASAGYISTYNLLSNQLISGGNSITISDQIIKINNVILPLDTIKSSLIPVSQGDILTFTSTLSASGSSHSASNFSFNIYQFMFYPEL